MLTFRDFLEAKKDSKERIIPGKTSYELTVPIQTKRYEDGADDSIEDVGDLLPERIIKQSNDPLIMVLSNPKKVEFGKLTAFAQTHELTISNFPDQLTSDEFRVIYEPTKNELFMWSGMRAHFQVFKDFNIPRRDAFIGLAIRKGRGVILNMADKGMLSTDEGDREAEKKIAQILKKGGISSRVKIGL